MIRVLLALPLRIGLCLFALLFAIVSAICHQVAETSEEIVTEISFALRLQDKEQRSRLKRKREKETFARNAGLTIERLDRGL